MGQKATLFSGPKTREKDAIPSPKVQSKPELELQPPDLCEV
jgi:hypothetical protein